MTEKRSSYLTIMLIGMRYMIILVHKLAQSTALRLIYNVYFDLYRMCDCLAVHYFLLGLTKFTLFEAVTSYKFLHLNNIICSSQFGFRPCHSTNQQLLLFIDRIHHSLNSNASCDVLYLDFRKAFDRVPHNELLLKLWNSGITGNCWYWIQEYLSNRSRHASVY